MFFTFLAKKVRISCQIQCLHPSHGRDVLHRFLFLVFISAFPGSARFSDSPKLAPLWMVWRKMRDGEFFAFPFRLSIQLRATAIARSCRKAFRSPFVFLLRRNEPINTAQEHHSKVSVQQINRELFVVVAKQFHSAFFRDFYDDLLDVVWEIQQGSALEGLHSRSSLVRYRWRLMNP